MSRQADVGNGPLCPTDPSHGHTYAARNPNDWKGYYCPHVAHAGLRAVTPGGPTAPTSPFFTPAEVNLAW
jgi:hypothetical protein